MRKKQALGRGLSALFDEQNNDDKDASSLVVDIKLNNLSAGKYQPRKYFNEDNLNDLAESISKNGVIQPIIVQKNPNLEDKYIIIAGERRWRASKLAGVATIPALIRDDLSDENALEFAIIENIQRQNLSPIEEAESYKRLIDEFDYSHAQLSENIGKSRSHITNMLRLLTLPESIKKLINDGQITTGHARAILKSDSPEELAEDIIEQKLSVRDVEQLMRENKTPSANKKNTTQSNKSANKDDDLVMLESTLSQNTGLNVEIIEKEIGGKIIIDYQNLSDLDKVIQKLCS